MSGIAGFRPTVSTAPDPDLSQPEDPFEEGELYKKWASRVKHSDNDFIMVIAGASKSGISGIGKTTLGVGSGRYFDISSTGFNAEHKATIDPDTFSKELLVNKDRVPNKSAIIFDEAQGTLSSNGADSRRSMAQSVMDITTALSTMRFRQNTAIIITQSTKWIDKRIDDVLDALVLIQERPHENAPVRAEVFETYYNDLELNPTRYTEHLDTITWPALPKDDPDYQYLHELKEKSALNKMDEEEEDQSLPKDKQIEVAQEMRNKGFEAAEIASSALIEYKESWVYKHTEAP